MARKTNIQWTHSTFSPWWGCTKVSLACDQCYAERDAKGQAMWGAGQPRRYFDDKHWSAPRRWDDMARARKAEDPSFQWRVFCASMSDVFDNEVAQEHRDRLWALIEETPNLTWMLLTKRIGNARRMIPERWSSYGFPENVWLGISVVTQEEADRDVPKLLSFHVPGKRFLSLEPLLEQVKLEGHTTLLAPGLTEGVDWLTGQTSQYSDIFGGDAYPWRERGIETSILHKEPHIHLVIVGGESGEGARPMNPEWVRSLRDECEVTGTDFMFKQWGEWAPLTGILQDEDDRGALYPHHASPGLETYSFGRNNMVFLVGRSKTNRLLDGNTHDGGLSRVYD